MWAGSRDIVSLGLAVKYQRRAGSSLWAGWKCQQGQSPTWSLAVPAVPASQRGGESPPAWSSPEFQSSQPYHGQWCCHPAAKARRGKALGQHREIWVPKSTPWHPRSCSSVGSTAQGECRESLEQLGVRKQQMEKKGTECSVQQPTDQHLSGTQQPRKPPRRKKKKEKRREAALQGAAHVIIREHLEET